MQTVGGARAERHRYGAAFTLSGADFCDTVPILFDNGRIIIPLVAGSDSCRLLFDTGCSQGVVYDGTPLAEQCVSLGGVVRSRDVNGIIDTLEAVRMPRLRIGRLSVDGYVASLQKDGPWRGRYDGVIGFDLLNTGLCAKIDVRRGRLILTDRRHLFDDERGYTLKYRLKWFVPYVVVSPFKRHADEALFDTGFRRLYTMNKRSFDKHAYKSGHVASQVEGTERGRITIGQHGVEREQTVAFLCLDRLLWDKFAFNNVRVVTTQGASRVGTELLRYGTIIINPFRGRITFSPFDAVGSIMIDNDPISVAYVPGVDSVTEIGLVYQGSEEYKGGMRQGDTLMRIDGVPIDSFRAFLNYPFLRGRRYHFTLLDRRGFTKTVTVRITP